MVVVVSVVVRWEVGILRRSLVGCVASRLVNVVVFDEW